MAHNLRIGLIHSSLRHELGTALNQQVRRVRVIVRRAMGGEGGEGGEGASQCSY